VTWGLALGIAGLALLDSLNPATLVAVTLILLGSRRRPALEAVAFVAGAYACVFALGLGVYLGAGAAADAVDGGLVWMRRIAFGVAAVLLAVSAVRALRSRQRTELGLPSWFSPGTAGVLGVVMTGADLPNAFPYFIAIERLLDAQVPTVHGVLTLAAYAAVYCLPCLVLLVLGLAHGDRVRRVLRAVHDRFGSEGVVPASRVRAALLLVAALGVATIAATA